LKALHGVHRFIVILVLCILFLIASIIIRTMLYDLFSGYHFASGAGMMHSSIDIAARRLHALLVLHSSEVFAITLAIAVVAAFLLWLELRHLLRRKPTLILSRGSLGEVAISLDQVGLLAQHEAEAIEGVREVHTIAESRKAGVKVRQIVAIEVDRQLPALAEEIQQRVKRSLEYHLGFPVIGVQVALQRTSLGKAVL
jgi:uncharacterized alkaline shock family protein YloU